MFKIFVNVLLSNCAEGKGRGIQMRIYIVLLLLLAGCASNGTQPGGAPEIERISGAELEQLMPQPTASLTLEDIVRLSTTGVPVDDIIGQLRQVGTFFDLAPSQAIDLHRRGVDSRVLDYLHQASVQAVRDSMVDEINRRGDLCQAQQDKLERELMRRSGAAYCGPYWGPYPYGPYRHYPGSGFYWGW